MAFEGYENFLPGDIYNPDQWGGGGSSDPTAGNINPVYSSPGVPMAGNPEAPINQPGFQTPDASQIQQPQTGGGNFTVDQLKQLVTAYDPTFLTSILPQLKAAGVEVQNQNRGDLRPRFRLPDGSVWDFGPGGWVSRGTAPPGFGDASQAPGMGGGAFGHSGGGFAGTGGSMGDWLHSTPGYEWAKQQGMDAIQKSAAAKGTLLTGGTLKALEGYDTGLADQLYNNQFNNYYHLLGLGLQGINGAYS